MWTLRDLFMFLSPDYRKQMAQRQRERELQASRLALPPQVPWFVPAEGPFTLDKLMWNDPRWKGLMSAYEMNGINQRAGGQPRAMRPGEDAAPEFEFQKPKPWYGY